MVPFLATVLRLRSRSFACLFYVPAYVEPVLQMQ
uniref:Uncharacterized protein n=1 Tax=Anopheles dirus TaxID=7168 RepID=A0A182NYY2_9DIPT